MSDVPFISKENFLAHLFAINHQNFKSELKFMSETYRKINKYINYVQQQIKLSVTLELPQFQVFVPDILAEIVESLWNLCGIWLLHCGDHEDWRLLRGSDAHSRSNSARSPASGASNFSEPLLMSPSRETERSCMCINQRVSVFRAKKVPAFVSLRSSCKHITEVGGP